MTDTDDVVSRWNRAQDDVALQHSDLALSTLAGMVSSGSIDVAPDFQRRDRWSHAKQSALIESFLINLPIPPVYLAEDKGGTYSVIDGRQRLTAIQAYFNESFALQGLTELTELNGMRFSQLPTPLRNSLAMRPLRCATLLRQTDPELKYLVFHRLNSAGEPLNAQEIRNVVYRGALNDLLLDLAQDSWLREALKISSDSSAAYRKMQDVEYVLRFLTLSEGWADFSGDLGRAMDSFMERHRDAGSEELDSHRTAFTTALERCHQTWGDHAFRRPEGSNWRDQPLAGLFDAQMISVSQLTEAEAEKLSRNSTELITRTRELFLEAEFETAVRTGTNTPSRVKYRIGKLLEVIRNVLKS